MKLEFILNGEDVLVQSEAESRLVDILRGSFTLLGTKSGCCIGYCGACMVIFNGAVVKSCLIPALKTQGSEIITIEGFSQTDEYQDILIGFSEAGLEGCGFCHTGKILAAGALIDRNLRPSKDEILPAFSDIRCRCTDPAELVLGVMAAADHRRRRLYG